jgi:cell wall assembly regulator SMI1
MSNHMKLPKMLIKFPPAKVEDIKHFENELSLKLSPDYKQFVLEVNGGRPAEAVFPIRGLELNPVGSINVLFGLQNEEPSSDLFSANSWFHQGIPNGIIIIGRDSGVNYICIDQRSGKDKVVFWDHAHFWGTGEWRDGDLYVVADSFNGFLASLTAAPP